MSYKRREFIGGSIAAGTGLLLSSLDVFSYPKTTDLKAKEGFSLKIMAPYWGFNGSVTKFCEKAKTDGYDGVEILWPSDIQVREEMFAALKKYDLSAGYLCRGDEAEADANLATCKKVIIEATENPHLKPLYINVHTGKDFFTYEENKRFIDFTISHWQHSGVPVYHETHRSRMLYSAPASLTFLKENPGLRITLDISHWCNVSESLLEDQPDTVNLVLERTDHIHSRVGHAQGPQIGDPRAPEWKEAVEAHFAWWDKVVAMKKREGKPLTMLTEFGPPTYMPTIPFTNKPVADQWDINVHMMQVWKKRYL